MKKKVSTRKFAAFAERTGIFLIEYQAVRDRIDILNRNSEPGDFRTLHDASEALASMIRGQHGDGSTVALTVRGLGSSHHILVLPQARPDLLRPVVAREMQRLYPELQDPIVDFVTGEPLDRRTRSRPEGGTPPQELLAAAIPRAAMADMIEVLQANEIQVSHVTVLPRVLQRIYAEAESRDAPSAVLMLLQGGPLFGFFYDRELRLVVEPPTEGDSAQISSQFVIEQLERGNLYLRQQFRGAQISRLLLAAEPGEFGPLSRAVEEGMGLVVERFAPQIGSSAAIAAMGAVLDAQDGNGLNLFPLGETRKKNAERTTRRIAMISAALLAVIAWWWAGNGVMAVIGWRTRINTLTVAMDRRAAPLAPMREIVRKRQQSAQQIQAIEYVVAERQKLQQLLQALSFAPQADVAIDGFGATRDAQGWTATVSGSAVSYEASEAVSSVHRFYRELPRMVNGTSIALENLTWSDSTAAGLTKIGFGLRYTTAPSDIATSSTPPL